MSGAAPLTPEVLERLSYRSRLFRQQAGSARAYRDDQQAASDLEADADAIDALVAEIKALREGLEPFALLAPHEDSAGVNMGDPLSKWFTIAQLVRAHDLLEPGR